MATASCMMICTLRRYLPNVGKDKSPDAVESWSL